MDRALIRCYPLRARVTCEQKQWRGTLHSPKLQYYLNLSIRLFCVISRILVRWVLPLCREAVSVFYSPVDWAKYFGKRWVWHTKHSLALYLSFLWRLVEFSFVLWFPEEASRFPTFFWMQDICLVMLILTDNNARNFSFTFINCQSMTFQNTIDFWRKRKKERDREREVNN